MQGLHGFLGGVFLEESNDDIQDNDSADDTALNPRANSEADRHGQNQHLSPTVLD